jgi:2-polyprenyl-3-methyl-5-hydroxy-6-metoxy-1,4-benzoquinol methylase
MTLGWLSTQIPGSMDPQTSAKSTEALARELEFQRHHAEAGETVRATPANVMERYRSMRYARIIQKDFMYRQLGVGRDLAGKRLLDFGCGTGQTSTQLAALGAFVVGIEISPELISLARQRAELDGVTDHVELQNIDLLKAPPPADSFDLVLCSAVLHHVDYTVVLPVLRGCLKPGGKIVIGEPIATSPLLRKIRNWLPVSRDASPDEKQFDAREIAEIAGVFDRSQLSYFNLTSRLIRFVPRALDLENAPAASRAVVLLMMTVDRWLSRLPLLHRFYGAVTIVGTKDAPASPGC